MPGCLACVVVGSKHRRKGIGSLLVKAAERQLMEKGVKKIRIGYPTYLRGTILSLIGVDIRWLGAVGFLQSLGYAPRRALDSMILSLENWKMPTEMVRKITDFVKKSGGRKLTLFGAVDKINYYGKAGFVPASTWLVFEKICPEAKQKIKG